MAPLQSHERARFDAPSPMIPQSDLPRTLDFGERSITRCIRRGDVLPEHMRSPNRSERRHFRPYLRGSGLGRYAHMPLPLGCHRRRSAFRHHRQGESPDQWAVRLAVVHPVIPLLVPRRPARRFDAPTRNRDNQTSTYFRSSPEQASSASRTYQAPCARPAEPRPAGSRQQSRL